MNGHDRRRQQITGRIKKSALELFLSQGVSQVSMDEIAARAGVSKVTIYKYFHSKAALHREVIDLYVDEILTSAEKVLDSDLNVVEKLKIALLGEANLPRLADGQALFDVLEKDGQSGGVGPGGLKQRIREMTFKIYTQAKQEGYLDENLSFELLNIYSEMFQAGFKAKLVEYESVLADPQSLDQLMHLYLFGILQKKDLTGSSPLNRGQ